VVLVLVSAVAFGTLAVLAPLAYAAGATPVTLLFLRFSTAGLLMLAYAAVRRDELPRGRLLAGLMLMGGAWYVLQALAYFTALELTSPGMVVLLLYLYPALTTLIAALFLKERVTWGKLLALALALVGCFFTIGPAVYGELLGVLLALAAAFLYASYIVVGGRVMEQVEVLPATAVITTSAGSVFGGLVVLRGYSPPTTVVGWAAVAASAVLSIVALGTFFAGLERVGPSIAAILSTVEPLVTILLARLLLGVAVEVSQLVGGGLIIGAVVALARLERLER
jgi:drug/metabolite transporter (DMT)-like permease